MDTQVDTPKPKSSLALRLISGIVLAPLVLFCLLYGSAPFIALVAVAGVLSLYEWLTMAQKSPRPVFDGMYGCVYVVLCLAAFCSLRYHYGHGAALTLALVLAVWASDIGAYFSGKAIGGAKMSPGISPNKTWAGLVGGMIASALVLCAYKLYTPPISVRLGTPNIVALQSIEIWKVAVLGAMIGAVGQAGDLFISMQKRKTGLKDTGRLIPGHGGILDRIDALLLAAPAFVVGLRIATL